jgi:hypothetical protein
MPSYLQGSMTPNFLLTFVACKQYEKTTMKLHNCQNLFLLTIRTTVKFQQYEKPNNNIVTTTATTVTTTTTIVTSNLFN